MALSPRAARTGPLLAAVGLLAFVVRLVPVLHGGGLTSYGRYDDGVYYAAADALTFGRLPYRDFVLLHPPGIALVLAPFALLGRATTDATGMGAARVVFMAIGAVNAGLVAAFCHRWGRGAAITGGLLYACWGSAVYAEQSTMLEPLGNTALLVALLVLIHPTRAPGPRAQIWAGVALGLAATVKIWCVAPWAVLVVVALVQRRWGVAARLAGAGAAAAAVVLLPFFCLAPGAMLRMVVSDQLGRHTEGPARLARLAHVFGFGRGLIGHQPVSLVVVAVLGVAILALCCWTERAARPVVLVLLVNVLVLLAGPTFFEHYASFAAAPAAAVVGIGFAVLLRRVRIPALLPATVALIVLGAAATAVAPVGKHLPESFTTLAPPGCVASDDPTVLVQLDRLSSDLRAGCVVPVDVSGITYDTLGQDGPSRRRNPSWQHFLSSYLLAGRSFVVARQASDHLTAAVAHELGAHQALATGNGLALRAATG